jgi:DNA-binding transcriptional LysR family regulator
VDRADFELVVTVARTGSLTAAARALHIAQPPLSRRLQQLEREVGAPLFMRGRHGATPTAVGRTLVARAEEALAAIALAEQDAADAAAGRAGRLRIGVTPTLGAVLLPPALAAFRRSHPHVRLDLRSSGDSEVLRADVRDGALDIAVAVAPARREAGTKVALRGEQRFVLIAPTDMHLTAAIGEPVPVATLKEIPLVSLPHGEGLRIQLDAVMAQLGAEPDLVIETSEREMLVSFVAAGLGASLVPEGVVRSRAVPGVRVHDLEPPVTRPVAAIVGAGRVPQLVDDFIAAVAQHTVLTAPRESPRTRSRSRAR